MGVGRSNYLSIGSLLIVAFLLPPCFCFPNNTTSLHTIHSNSRDTLEIGIGIGIGGGSGSTPPPPPGPDCPPPPPPPCPPTPEPPPPPAKPPTLPPLPPRPPSPATPPLRSFFLNELQYRAYLVIRRFKKTITSDPMNVTRTWSGYRPCQYMGFACDVPPDRKNTPTIASVDFNGFRLGAPTICGFIDKLPDLAIFHANSNNLKGTIPNLIKLRFLYELDVSNNKMSGPFPANVLPLNNLTFLDLRFNAFAGIVPAPIFVLDLDVLFLNNNNFNQPLPTDLGSSPVLYLTLANNGFTGPIPCSIGNASNTLIEVLFLSNRLSGCLPYEVGLLKNATVFDAGFNQITGPIPLSFGCLRKVEQLNLAGNLLYGEVPDVVCRLATTGHLANLSLSGNYFTSVGPSCWKLIRNRVLDLRRNCVPELPGQRPPDECEWFLGHPKVCPLLTDIPCRLPWNEGDDDLPSTGSLPDKPPADRARAQTPSTAYSAVHKRHAS